MRRSCGLGIVTVALAMLLSSANFLRAQDDPGADDPTRGVARISIVQGEVNVKRGDAGELVAAAVNAPLMTQDHIQTADGSRSEVQFDAANMARLAPNTDLALADVQRGRYQLQLGMGTVIFRVLRDSHANVEIDTPSISVQPARQGIYRVSVTQDGTTEVTVRSGEASIFSPRGSQPLRAGQTMLARGSNADPEFQVEAEVARDQFDDWSNNRDQTLLSSRSYQYVSPDIYGADDLDSYGTWVPSSYGTVWAPRVQAGWAPYQTGRWVWADYYGWTWVDYSPWGWAPFHYGRWFWNGPRGWCWWPGAIHQPYFWRPAVVGFFGFGGGGFGVSIGFHFGNVGWVPLAPYEAWHPWYGRGFYGGYNRTTVINNTIVNNTNIYNVYRNARVNNAIAYTSVNGFGQGRQAFYRGNGAQFQNASLVRGPLPVTPSRASLAFGRDGAAFAPRQFASVQNRQFFSHQQPPQAQRMPFAEQQQRVAQFQERTLGFRPNYAAEQNRPNSFAQGNGGRPGFNQGGSAYGAVPRPGSNQMSGFRSSEQGTARPQPSANDGWQRFGQGAGGGMPTPGAAANRPTAVPRPGVSSPANSGWQGRPQTGPNNAPNTLRREDQSGWHRFGDPGVTNSYGRTAVPRPGVNRDSDGWHSFGSPRDAGSSYPANRSYGSAQGSAGQYRSAEPSFGNYRSQEPMRMNQPIVRDRPSYSAPQMSSPRYNAPAAPRYSAPSGPQYSAPRSAPAYGGGGRQSAAPRGGGGGSRPSGGNGGGHHR
jgi:hypothetical protein